jgi:uncharacterized protein YqfA (UPF0365 family)
MNPVSAWLRFRRVGAPLSLLDAAAMSLRRVLTPEVVEAIETSHRKKLAVDPKEICAHAMAGGRPGAVVVAFGLSEDRQLGIPVKELYGIDLMGRDPVKFVEAYAQAKAENRAPTSRDFLKEFLASSPRDRSGRV